MPQTFTISRIHPNHDAIHVKEKPSNATEAMMYATSRSPSTAARNEKSDNVDSSRPSKKTSQKRKAKDGPFEDKSVGHKSSKTRKVASHRKAATSSKSQKVRYPDEPVIDATVRTKVSLHAAVATDLGISIGPSIPDIKENSDSRSKKIKRTEKQKEKEGTRLPTSKATLQTTSSEASKASAPTTSAQQSKRKDQQQPQRVKQLTQPCDVLPVLPAVRNIPPAVSNNASRALGEALKSIPPSAPLPQPSIPPHVTWEESQSRLPDQTLRYTAQGTLYTLSTYSSLSEWNKFPE